METGTILLVPFFVQFMEPVAPLAASAMAYTMTATGSDHERGDNDKD